MGHKHRGPTLIALAFAATAAALDTKCGGVYECRGGTLVADRRGYACERTLRATGSPQHIKIECDGCCPRNHSFELVHDQGPTDRVSFQLAFVTVDKPQDTRLELTLSAIYYRAWRTIGYEGDVQAGTNVTRYDRTMGVALEIDTAEPYTVAFVLTRSRERVLVGLDSPRSIMSITVFLLAFISGVLGLWRSSYLVKYTHTHRMSAPRSRRQYWNWFFCQPRLRAAMEANLRELRKEELKDELDAEAAIAACRHGPLRTLELDPKQLARAQEEQCAVCIEDFGAEQELSLLACGHLFHRPCISHWFQFTTGAVRRCPVCKEDALLHAQDAPDALGSAAVAGAAHTGATRWRTAPAVPAGGSGSAEEGAAEESGAQAAQQAAQLQAEAQPREAAEEPSDVEAQLPQGAEQARAEDGAAQGAELSELVVEPAGEPRNAEGVHLAEAAPDAASAQREAS